MTIASQFLTLSGRIYLSGPAQANSRESEPSKNLLVVWKTAAIPRQMGILGSGGFLPRHRTTAVLPASHGIDRECSIRQGHSTGWPEAQIPLQQMYLPA